MGRIHVGREPGNCQTPPKRDHGHYWTGMFSYIRGLKVVEVLACLCQRYALFIQGSSVLSDLFWSFRNSSFVPVCVSHFPSLYAGFFELPDVCFCRPMNGRTTTEPTILPSENGSPPMFIPAGSRYETSWLRRYSLA